MNRTEIHHYLFIFLAVFLGTFMGWCASFLFGCAIWWVGHIFMTMHR